MRLLSLAIVLATLSAAVGHADWQSREPTAAGLTNRIHPAVVRIITPLRDGMALGSGTLLAVNDTQGLVISNWHVVEGAAGPISVLFPDGFSSTAVVLKTDRDWDLAALLIRRPNVEPVSVATRAPRRGELLTIAGYGSGTYRAATGRCTQYVAPSPNRPLEMVELATSARQGDSGGPIFNAQGELAGVLFGTGGGSTIGSYCGRVRGFLASIVGPQPQSEPRPDVRAIAQRPRRYETTVPTDTPPSRAVAAAPKVLVPPPPTPNLPPLASVPAPPRESLRPTPGQGVPTSGQNVDVAAAPASVVSISTQADERPSIEPPAAQTAPPVTAQPIAASSMAEQLKTFLALVGLVAILFHGLRLLSLAQGS